MRVVPRSILAGAILFLAAGCWVTSVPTPPMTTLTPTSEGGAGIGVPQEFAMPHCGINSPIDFDGSFWDPILPVPAPLEFDNSAGFIRLADADAAVFVSSAGRQLRLIRHVGDKAFVLCE